jgi:pyruvate dehydrogenase E2 component (dihydrolipoamide acetyltransferase)
MATPVELPKLGNTVEECLIAGWRKRKGDTVAAGDVLADIETDKTTFELSAPVAGTVLETFFEQGALVPVFTNLCVIGKNGENIDEFRPRSSPAPGSAGVPPAPGAQPNATAKSPNPAVAPKAASTAAPLSPRAAKFAREHNLNPASVTGSGPGGRVLEQDLRNAASNSSASKAGEPDCAGLPGIRGKIARRMRESLASTAQYTLNSSAAAGALLRLRAKLKESKATADITIHDLVAFCTVKALLEVPALNAELINGRFQQHAHVHIGFACDTPRGLMVPVVRDAHRLPLAELARQTKELAGRAVQGTISVDDLSGATFTISNLGNLGIESFTPLLNPPQVAILGVGAVGVKTLRRQGNIVFVDSLGLSLTCDHQAIDGAPGARFLQVLADKIEHVEALCAA